ncbi:MAG: amidohydrolase [archaeon GB-1867-005]|nr:amidohydrolase [Candidatus Culexmicrobium cathedralense]
MNLFADLVILNANVITMDEEKPKAEAIAIKDKKIIYVGSNKDVEELIGGNTKVIDVKGKTVVPGFIDTHIHLIGFGFSLMWIDLRDATSIEDIKSKVKSKVEVTPKGRWILGRGWDQDKFIEGRYPTRWDLDEVSPENPVMLRRVCGHICVVNSKALEIAGITKDTPDPEGGKIDRNESGEPTGILREKAMQFVWEKIPKPTLEESLEAAEKACKEAVKHGITTVHFVSATPEEFRLLQILKKMDKLPLKVCLYIKSDCLEHLTKLGVMRGFGDDNLKINGVKLLVDGSLGARTAALSEPYADDPVNPNNMGIVVLPYQKLAAIVEKAHEAGLQLAIHAIGDRAIEMAINAVEAAIKKNPRLDHRHRIEHASVIREDLIKRMSELGMVASVQPRFIISDFWSVDRVGPRRAKWVYPFKSMMKSGVRIGGGSDCPVDPLDPIYQIYSAVTRGKFEKIKLYEYTANECLTPLEAIRMFTLDAAYLGFEEDIKGSIKVGKVADIVVLSDDPTEIPAEKLKDIEVIMTIVNGAIVYSATS